MPSEINQIDKENYHMISLIGRLFKKKKRTNKNKHIGMENRVVITRGGRVEGG